MYIEVIYWVIFFKKQKLSLINLGKIEIFYKFMIQYIQNYNFQNFKNIEFLEFFSLESQRKGLDIGKSKGCFKQYL